QYGQEAKRFHRSPPVEAVGSPEIFLRRTTCKRAPKVGSFLRANARSWSGAACRGAPAPPCPPVRPSTRPTRTGRRRERRAARSGSGRRSQPRCSRTRAFPAARIFTPTHSHLGNPTDTSGGLAATTGLEALDGVGCRNSATHRDLPLLQRNRVYAPTRRTCTSGIADPPRADRQRGSAK